MLSSKLRASQVWNRGLLCRVVRANRRCSSTGKGSSTPTVRSPDPASKSTAAPTPPPRHISPVNLREEDVSTVYCLSREEAKSVFPQGLSTKFASMVDSLGRGCWILRRQSYEIIKSLRNYSPGKSQDTKFLLYGPDGSGKSICLSQVVHWAVESGWMVIHVPSVFSWTHSKEEIRSSTKHPETHDQPKEAVTWLKNFRSLNSKYLNDIPLSEDHAWTKREKSTAGDSLTKVIEQGLLRPAIATEVVGVVLNEVAMEANNSKTLLAVDEFNGCFNPTSIRLGRNNWAEPGQLNLIKYLTTVTSPGGFPGCAVLSLSRTKMYRHHVHSCKPQDLLGPEGIDAVGDFAMVEVPCFNRLELDSCLRYYSQEKWFNKPLTPVTSSELWYLSLGNPSELHRLCSSL